MAIEKLNKNIDVAVWMDGVQIYMYMCAFKDIRDGPMQQIITEVEGPLWLQHTFIHENCIQS